MRPSSAQQKITHLSRIAVLVVTALLLSRLWYLQVIRGEHFRRLSENNRTRLVRVPSSRGFIYDKHNNILVKNRSVFGVEEVIEDNPEPSKTRELLSQIINQPIVETNLGRKNLRFQPKTLAANLTYDQVAKIAANRFRLPGITISSLPSRDYPHREMFAHLIGYTGEITKAQLDDIRFQSYYSGDVIGQYGIELAYDKQVRGEDGVQKIEVNARGFRVGESAFASEIQGSSVKLTIDTKLQESAFLGLNNRRGAVIAMDPNTGEILALASSPSFDPNLFATGINNKIWNEIANNADKPLRNRATQGTYPPGSVFKMFVALAGLEQKLINSNSKVYCPGYYSFAGRNYRCHKESGHGRVDLIQAIAQSCDVFFYQLGLDLGVDNIAETANTFGFGRLINLEFSRENKGLIPSTEWKKNNFRNKADQKWFAGETLSVAIGQGATLVTPLQIARGVAALVNGGYLVQPHVLVSTKPVKDKLPYNILNLEVIRQGMIEVVNGEHGTGGKSKLTHIVVGGKTGTAQVAGRDHYNSTTYEDHAWFVGFAPADKPTIVVVALLENAGHGGSVAAPLVKSVLERYFDAT